MKDQWWGRSRIVVTRVWMAMVTVVAVVAPEMVMTACSSSSPATDPLLPLEVKTLEGSVKGDVTEASVRVFRGIPYAAPPTGPNRWKRPQPVTPWTIVRDATVFGKRCPQPKIDGAPSTENTDEDCLYLNVYTPLRKPNTSVPVMVWIHGGGFTTGSSSDEIYEASKLVKATNVMVVSFNYRLGALGFLGHSTLAAEDAAHSTGNYGLFDQLAVLEWVGRNASFFGGDPRQVTIFGESSGGLSVSLLATWPEAGFILQRAIIQSGPSGAFFHPSVQDAEKEAGDLAKVVGCTGADIIGCLRTKPANDLVAALKHTPESQPAGGVAQGSVKAKLWFPVVDGHVLRDQPTNLLASKAMAKVPYILGTMLDEGGLLYTGLVGDKKLTSESEYLPALELTFGKDSAPKIAARYAPSAFKDVNAALARTTTLSYFTCPSRRMARATASAGNATFLYEHRRGPSGGLAAGLAPVHGDVVFLFDSDTSAGGRPGDDARGLVNAMQGYWSSFARTGTPSALAAQVWPPFVIGNERYLVLDVPTSTASGLDKDDCDFWDGIPTQPLPLFYLPPT